MLWPSLDLQVKKDVQKTLDAKDMGIPITVIEVTLIKVSTNKYEGVANMQAAGHQPHQIAIGSAARIGLHRFVRQTHPRHRR